MSAAQNNSSLPPPVKNALHTSSSHSHSAQVHPQPNNNQQPQVQSHGNNINGGGLLYNNLIPGHYRYGATPPAPPVGPLSYSNISQSSQSSQQQQHQQMNYKNTPNDLRQQNNNIYGSSQQPLTHQLHYNNVSRNNHTYANVPSTTTAQPINHNTSSNNNYSDVFLEVSEPEDDFDDDLLVIASSDMMEEVDLDDEKYYKPFRHLGGSNGSVGTHNSQRSQSSSSSPRSKSSSVKTKKKAVKTKESTTNNEVKEETKPMDILTVLLSGPAVAVDDRGADGNTIDITIMIEEAATKSSRARSMTNALVLQEKEHPQQEITNSDSKEDTVDNDLYVATANAHTEAAISFQRVYKKLLGLKNEVGTTTGQTTVTSSGERIVGTLSQSEELAKSMIILANGHARMAKSLGEMGVKWNMGKVDDGGRMVSKNSNDVNTTVNNKTPTSTSKDSNDDCKRRESTTSNERLRMAVRGALDTANHEDDITNSTFLARSTVLNANKKLAASSKVPNKKDMKNKGKRGDGSGGGVNPVDDLMKLEKELRSMDMALEMGNSVASLGTAVASRPNNDLLGGSYMSSSSMWTSGIFGGRKSNPKQQQGAAGVRSRANHLQNFPGKSAAAHAPAANLSHQQHQGVQITPNAALDQSWWGGGGGQGSILATTAVASNQRTQQQTLGSNQVNASTNAKQLMQLMDSLNRLGNENAQLMREVEEAKAARAETEAAKQMMAQFKTDYNQRFNKVKEALEKYKHASGDNPVGNSAYVKSASALELQKKDQMIKKLADDLRKERSESKKKDTALRKYEGFYLEVKKRSAEKREQQQRQQQANAAANKAANKK